jgi:hypothetical protein
MLLGSHTVRLDLFLHQRPHDGLTGFGYLQALRAVFSYEAEACPKHSNKESNFTPVSSFVDLGMQGGEFGDGSNRPSSTGIVRRRKQLHMKVAGARLHHDGLALDQYNQTSETSSLHTSLWTTSARSPPSERTFRMLAPPLVVLRLCHVR